MPANVRNNTLSILEFADKLKLNDRDDFADSETHTFASRAHKEVCVPLISALEGTNMPRTAVPRLKCISKKLSNYTMETDAWKDLLEGLKQLDSSQQLELLDDSAGSSLRTVPLPSPRQCTSWTAFQ